MTTLPPRRIYLSSKLKRENEISIVLFVFPGIGAGNEARTRDPNLGKVVLYH